MKRIGVLFSILLCALFAIGQDRNVKRVAILEVSDPDNVLSYGLKMLVKGKLTAAVTSIPGYEGYERSDISSILLEQEFQRTGLVSDSQIKALGEMTGTDYILTIQVLRYDGSHAVLTSKILNIETAKLDKISDIVTPVNIVDIENNCEKLVKTLFEKPVEKREIRMGDSRYTGEVVGGIPNGIGTMYFSDNDALGRERYHGMWNAGKPQGQGTLLFKDGSTYNGCFSNGLRSGEGVYTSISRSSSNEIIFRKTYKGLWSIDMRNGRGKLLYYRDLYLPSDIFSIDGVWENNELLAGVFNYYDGTSETLCFVKDNRSIMFDRQNANFYYVEGSFQNDLCTGVWKLYDNEKKYIEKRVFKDGVLLEKKERTGLLHITRKSSNR